MQGVRDHQSPNKPAAIPVNAVKTSTWPPQSRWAEPVLGALKPQSASAGDGALLLETEPKK